MLLVGLFYDYDDSNIRKIFKAAKKRNETKSKQNSAKKYQVYLNKTHSFVAIVLNNFYYCKLYFASC